MLVFWLFVKRLIYIMALVFIMKLHDLVQVLVSFFGPIAILIDGKINGISFYG